jgi:hypothetical protein
MLLERYGRGPRFGPLVNNLSGRFVQSMGCVRPTPAGFVRSLDYEFRIGLRNYRANPAKVELWDRPPKPDGEAVAVSLVKTSVELSKDAIYQRMGRADNLLLWDIQVPPGTIGDKTMYLNYEFRLEYSRDLPQPRFVSGGLREAPIGGGAMPGMGGIGGNDGGDELRVLSGVSSGRCIGVRWDLVSIAKAFG